MATKKTSGASGKKGGVAVVLTVLAAAGPLAIKAAQAVQENPELSSFVKKQLEKLGINDKSTPEAMLATLEVLREQVGTLTESADDGREAAQAVAWSAKLESATHAAKLLAAPGSTAKQRKTLKKQIDALREEIFSAYVSELEEDAAAATK